MFENCLGHERVIKRLSAEVKSGSLPSSLLFVGAEASGRLTAAFELSRVLMCREKGKWGCPCPSCAEHWLLASNSVLLLGKRNVLPELQAHLQLALRSSGEEASQYARILILRSVHKLIAPFNPALAPVNDSVLKKVASELERLKELLAPIYHQPLLNSITVTESWQQQVAALAEKVQAAVPPGVSVEAIRSLRQWAWTSGHEVRTVIIDGAETLNPSAANSLLKILEEPPKNLFFILLSHCRGAVLPTLLSRLRVYDFRPRRPESEREVLKRIFREPNGEAFSSVRDYLNSFLGIHSNELEAAAQIFLSHVCGTETGASFSAEALFARIGDSNRFFLFLEALLRCIREAGKPGAFFPHPFPLRVAESWNGFIREAAAMHRSYNQNIKSLSEALFLQMKYGAGA